jgi:membrane fusion protein, multidrug efflux system
MASPVLESEEMIESEKNPGQPVVDNQAAPPVSPAVEHSETGAEEAAPQKRNGPVAFLKQHPLAAAAVLLVAIAGAVALSFYFSSYETTDDAEVDGHLNPVSARISGTIIRVNPDILNNHFVTAGTVLAEIDPADFQADVARAQAEQQRLRADAAAAHQDVAITSSSSSGRLQSAQAAVTEASDSVASEKATVDADQARVAQAQANYTRSEADRQRWENLLAKREVSQTEYARIATQAATDNQALIAARAEYIAAQKRVSQAESRWSERKADLLGARSAPEQVASTQSKASAAVADADRAGAQLTTAELNLSYTKIIAPVSGIVGRKSIEVGQRIQPGQQLLIIIPVDDIWITANFKETQLKKMHPGQPVTIHLDSYDRDYQGHVDALAGATGSRFSLLPAENATGNYVKVVQRVPVRIVLDPKENADHLLRPGMSVEAKVKLVP